MSLKNEINNYIKTIQKHILYKTKETKIFINDLKLNIADYIEENQVTDMSEIRQYFGTEEELANSFLEMADIKTLKRKITIKRLIAVFAVAIIAIWGICVIAGTIGSNEANGAYEVHYEIVEESNSLYTTQEIRS